MKVQSTLRNTEDIMALITVPPILELLVKYWELMRLQSEWGCKEMHALSVLVVIVPEDKLPKEENTRQLGLLLYFSTKYAGNINWHSKVKHLVK